MERELALAYLAKVKKFLADYGGDVQALEAYLRVDQRLGQAFFNAMTVRQQEAVRGVPGQDPFYDDTLIPETIRQLVRLEELWREERDRAATNHD